MPQQSVARLPNFQASGTVNHPVHPGAELYALCQTATADGRLCLQELERLKSWRNAIHPADVPTWELVQNIVDNILAAGKVAPAELPALRQALAPVLPSELRRRPASMRIVTRGTKRDFELESTERRPNEILASAHFVVAGCQCERIGTAIARHARVGEPVLLIRDTDDSLSSNAIEVRTASGKMIGYVPEEHARELAPLLDRGARYRAHLTSCMTGPHARVLVVQAYLYAADATLGLQSAVVRKIPRRRGNVGLWALRISIGALITFAVAAVLGGGA